MLIWSEGVNASEEGHHVQGHVVREVWKEGAVPDEFVEERDLVGGCRMGLDQRDSSKMLVNPS